MTIDELLEIYRDVFAMTEVEKGERFERLMRNFLLTYPVWRGVVDNVWRWKDFPHRQDLGGKDLGIDLVAKTVSGEFWAVQCKFYAETTTIDKPAVDSFISNSARTFNGDNHFTRRLWISTTERYTDNAREMFKNQSPAVEVINLETLRRAQVNWSRLDNGFTGKEARIKKFLRDYQLDALNAAHEHFHANERGQLIMACGTGKTFTALKIVERETDSRGLILYLVPSISLLNQTLEEWSANAVAPVNAVCVCSDGTVAEIDDDIVDVNLLIPVTTDTDRIKAQLSTDGRAGLTVVFSTYQSLEKVAAAQIPFDWIICDEAHRTTTFKENATLFTKVHDKDFIRAKHRLYMTATPKLAKTDVKKDTTDEEKLTAWSMSNETLFGKEFYRISFAEAVKRGCLSDYKVFILTVDERDLNSELRKAIDDEQSTLTADEVLKLIGCINALSKNMDAQSARFIADDPNFMRTAVAFNRNIKESDRVKKIFPDVQEKYLCTMNDAEKNSLVRIETAHIDGTMSSVKREGKLHWLKTPPANVCRVLNNVRCLSEGVDVPALDAIIFLSSRKSKVEIVQAVGRVMRKAPNKKFGYIIIPVVVPLEKSPEDALAKSKDFNIVWDVINALRAHDDAMNVEIERIKNTGESGKVIPGKIREGNGSDKPVQLQLLLPWDELRDKIYARMVEHVGNRLYWIQWAYKVADIVERHTARIKELIDTDNDAKAAFDEFTAGLRKNLNPSVNDDEAVDMLAQHLITRPVFEALFENYSFTANNPVSQAMQQILERLDRDDMSKDREIFNRLYDQVRDSCKNMGDAASRQRIIIRLYNSFFGIALKKTADKLGIVYTPVEVVDFILRSVDAVLKKHFNRSLSDKNVHVLDPFTGTGTFIVRLIQSGLIRPEDLQRKYQSELHANELVLLAYYIAAINVENAFHDAAHVDYLPFPGICFTDTFQLYERGQTTFNFPGFMEENSARVKEQQAAPIEVIVGNPPYSVGQRSANDDNRNEYYPNLEARIAATYAAKTNATNKNSLYDSYIKAFRWASDRIADGGVIGFVTNAGWLDGAAMDGLRKSFANEFSAIYVFNLRGNARTQGELRRKESGNVFGGGSRAPIAVTILVKTAHSGSAQIFYHEVADYLRREQKLELLQRTPNVLCDEFKPLIPNKYGDWLNQRGDSFDTFIPLAPDTKFDGVAQSFFVVNSKGMETGRDPWAYNFSQPALERNMRTTIDYYNKHEPTDLDPTKIIWTRATVNNKARKLKISFDPAQIVKGFYRPFCQENIYRDKLTISYPSQMPNCFPTGNEDNLLICLPGAGLTKSFSVLMTNKITDVQFQFNGQCFPLYWYAGSERRDGISDYILNEARKLYGDVTREDVFYYVYGFLHLSSYRERFAAELKKSLPRIILTEPETFWRLSKAGRELANIHLNYEQQPPAQVEVIGGGDYRVDKLKLSKDKRTLTYNKHITIRNIPPRSFEYVVNGRSPLEWIIDRYRVKPDPASGIVNDANAWGIEHGNPRYILDLILSCITVSLKTLDIVDNLPEIDFDA